MRKYISIALLVLAWEISARLLKSPLFPRISLVVIAFFKLLLSGEAFIHVLASLNHILIGISLAILLGTFGGLAMAQSKSIELILTPLVDSIRPVAALTIFPLLILIFGLGIWSKAVVILWTAWPAILINTIHGIKSVDSAIVEAAQIDGADPLSILKNITFPLALPTILTGWRIGMGGGWISLVSAEMLGASSGLGYSILAYSQTFRFPEMYAVILMIALLGWCMNTSLDWLQKKSVCLIGV